MEGGSLRGGSSSKKLKKPRPKNIQDQQTNPFNTHHPYVPMQGFAPYSPGTQQQFNRWEQSFLHDQSSQQFEWQQQQQFHQQSPFQDYREPNNDESDSSDQNKTLQLESDEEEEEPVRAPEKRPQGRKAAKRWSDEEEVALAKSWLTVSENPEVGNAQKRDGFYRKVIVFLTLRALQEEKDARITLMRRQQQALNEQQKAVDLEFMMKDHSCYQDPMLQLILDRKREIAARWGCHCPF
ncbi:hypothetical protein R6Q57_025162 [Mikania cordata]